MDKEVRAFTFKIETREDDGPPVLQGHAAVFNEETSIMGFNERIAPGAFKDSIKTDDVRALFNHDPNHVLGRNKAGTLELREDKHGLAIKVTPPDTQFARDLMTSIKRGDIDQMSFGFQTVAEEWREGKDGEPDLRTLKEVRLFDISPVTFPAYEGTAVAVRSHDTWQKDNKPWKLNLLKKKLKLRKAKED